MLSMHAHAAEREKQQCLVMTFAAAAVAETPLAV